MRLISAVMLMVARIQILGSNRLRWESWILLLKIYGESEIGTCHLQLKDVLFACTPQIK